MPGKLCIIISSIYPPTTNPLWSEEVEEDLRIVKETLNDHEFKEIYIPVAAGTLLTQRLLNSALTDINHTHTTECHIVLNTHGTPGFSDIKHQVVANIVTVLSQNGINITQISALMCDGMAQQSLEQARSQAQHRFSTFSSKVHPRKASMVTLQKILNSLSTDIVQNFTIRGFDYAYLPKDARDEVVGILKGEEGKILNVHTQTTTATISIEYAEQIRANIDIVQRYAKKTAEISALNYHKAGTVLGKILTKMKTAVFNAVQNNTVSSLKSEFQPLYTALETYIASTHIATELNAKNFEKVYKNWLKDKKLYSEERLTVLKEHVRLSLAHHNSPDDQINAQIPTPQLR
ncbi:MAG: hypothetical protein ACO1N3_03060 [Gammaproteobacteria bacterium]